MQRSGDLGDDGVGGPGQREEGDGHANGSREGLRGSRKRGVARRVWVERDGAEADVGKVRRHD